MKKYLVLIFLFLFSIQLAAQTEADFVIEKKKEEIKEFKFIGYYFIRSEVANMYASNEFLKGQVVGRLFGGNTTKTGLTSKFTEQRFIPIIAYTPKLFDGWATMRMSFEFDWTWGDANYGAGGNFGGAFGADFVNMQTQNLYVEFRPQKNFFVNAGLGRIFDNIRVPAYTPTDELVNTGYRLALWGSDGVGIAAFYMLPNQRFKAGVYQLYENNVQDDDDVSLYELDYEYDFSIKSSAGLSVYYLSDRANGEGGVSILGQGLNSGLSNYNGVFNFDFGTEKYTADIFWIGSHFHSDPLLRQGRFGYSGFVISNLGQAKTDNRTIDIAGMAANLRLAYKYGINPNDFIALDGIFTSGDEKNINDGKYNGFLTGNNWTAPGAVFFSHGLYLLLPHGNVVNRFMGAVIDIQNLGYGLSAASLTGHYDLIPHKLRAKAGLGIGMSNVTPAGGGSMIGTEFNVNLRYTLRVFMDLELHAAYLKLGDFYDSSVVNGNSATRPEDPWTLFASFKWIMF
ncbi:MAG: hypothetical protein SCALA702_19780 [Melioribacteraceae bacterium]|nr:MAG: hypothetical protein SCALA702_19780 [Melioribacteraceae bacterium]